MACWNIAHSFLLLGLFTLLLSCQSPQPVQPLQTNPIQRTATLQQANLQQRASLFETKAFSVIPPDPVPLPSLPPANCPFANKSFSNRLGHLNAHYELESYSASKPKQENTTSTATAIAKLILRADTQQNLDIEISFRSSDAFPGESHQFGGRFLVPAHDSEHDFTYTSADVLQAKYVYVSSGWQKI
jgi:hypothetical protein